MNYQQVLALIQQFIVANGNNEITANVLRPILEAILAQPNDLIGDLGDLQTNDQSNLVSAINEVLDVISPPIGSVNTKIHPISLFGIDPELPELTKIAEAVRLQGPFTCDAGQQMVFHTIATVGNQTNGSIVTRYYRLLRNLTTIGGVGVGQTMLPSWFMPDGVSEYINPVADGTIIELGDIASSEVWDVFNLGNNGEAWDMNEYRFIRATQNGNIQLWAFVGQERYYGGPDIEVEPDIFEAFESDFFLITDQTPGGGNIFAIYTDVAVMLADQTNQIDQEIYYVEDASADDNLNFPSGETKLQAFYRYNGTATNDIDDYTLISAPYANQSGSDFQGITTANTSDINLSGNGTEADPLEAELTQDVKDEITKGVEAYDYTLDDVVQNGNETTKSIILSSEGHPSEFIEIGVKEFSPGVGNGAIEIFSANGYGILSAHTLGFSGGGKIATFGASGIGSYFSDGKDIAINFPTDNPIPFAPNINSWFVLSVNGAYANEKGEIRLYENEQVKMTSSEVLLSSYNNHTVFFDGTNLTIDVDMNISELPPRAEVYFYNLGDSDVEFNFIVAPGWSLPPGNNILEPNGTCILMRVLDEQKLILIGNE